MEPVDLLLITWNRREYVEKTLENLLADPSDFQLYCWGNGSEDGTADLIASIDDPRVEERHFSQENVMQRPPCLWFFETAKGDVCGMIDDDILLPHGWTHTIEPMLRNESSLGRVGCWIFMPEDYDEAKASQNIVRVGDYEVLRVLTRAGQSFLGRREVLARYGVPPGHTHGFPVDQTAMSLAGMINGFTMPLLEAHNMDAPRSEHCMMRRSKTIGEQVALTARKLGFETPEEYTAWIAADARMKVGTPMKEQLRRAKLARDHSIFGSARRRIDRVTRRLRSAS